MTKALALTAKQIEAARAGGPKQLTDGRGLYLKLAFPSRLHSWRFDFKSPATGKRNTLILGTWPDLTLAGARDAADDARRMIASGVCPAASRNDERAALAARLEREELLKAGKPLPGSLRALEAAYKAERWLPVDERPEGFLPQWGDGHADKWTATFANYIHPALGAKLMAEITYSDLVTVVIAIPFPTVRDLAAGFLEQLFSWARRRGHCPTNTAEDLRQDLPARPAPKGRAAPENERDLRATLAVLDAFHIDAHRDALQIGLLTMQRPGNVAGMRIEDLDLEGGQFDWSRYGLSVEHDGPVWVIPSQDMKRRQAEKRAGLPHVVPLPAQAVAIIKRRIAANVKGSPFVFPGKNKGDVQGVRRDSISRSIKAMGLRGKLTAHGLRATGRTILDEVHGENERALEAQLAHKQGTQTTRAYARASYLQQRAEIMQRWADYLDQVRAPNVVTLRAA